MDPALRARYAVDSAPAPRRTSTSTTSATRPRTPSSTARRWPRPGVVVLHDWSLHHLVLRETVERGDVAAYLREMRRAHGEAGTFVGRQVARALGGDLLPALFPLNDRVLEAQPGRGRPHRARSAARAARRLPGRPVLHLPHHLSLPLDPPAVARGGAARAGPARGRARRHRARAGHRRQAAATSRVRAVGAPARGAIPALRLVVAGGVDPRLPARGWARGGRARRTRCVVTGRLDLADFVRHLVRRRRRAGPALPLATARCRARWCARSAWAGPALVTAGTPAAEEFPEGVVVPVDPGPARGGRARGAARPPARATRAARAHRRAGPRPRAARITTSAATARAARRASSRDVARAARRRCWPRSRPSARDGGRPARLLHGGGALGRARPRPRRRAASASSALLRRARGRPRRDARPTLSVVIPAFNEAAAPAADARADARATSAPGPALRDPGGGRRLARRHRGAGARRRAPTRAAQRGQPRQGLLGPARACWPRAGARRLMTDADLSTPIEELDRAAGAAWTRATTW